MMCRACQARRTANRKGKSGPPVTEATRAKMVASAPKKYRKGERVGNWEIIRYAPHEQRYFARCLTCGRTGIPATKNLTDGSSTGCMSCRSTRTNLARPK